MRKLPSTYSIERITTARLPTKWGDFTIIGYQSVTGNETFVALCKGDIKQDQPTLVRVHSQCLTGESFGSVRCDCGLQLDAALELIAQNGVGVLVYQLQEGRGIGLLNKIRAYRLQDKGADTVEANEKLGLVVDLRDYKQCVEIISELGVKYIRLLTNNPLKVRAMLEFGLTVVERVPLEVHVSRTTIPYLLTKKHKLGHLLNLDYD